MKVGFGANPRFLALASAGFDLGWVLETSPREPLGGSSEHLAVHRGEVITDTPYAQLIGNVMVCWPTKLTLVPMLGDLVLAGLGKPGVTKMPAIPHKLELADPPWQN